jgi:hypothetical protein
VIEPRTPFFVVVLCFGFVVYARVAA